MTVVAPPSSSEQLWILTNINTIRGIHILEVYGPCRMYQDVQRLTNRVLLDESYTLQTNGNGYIVLQNGRR